MKMQETLHANFLRLIDESGLTGELKTVAEKIGFDTVYTSHLKAGRRNITFETAEKIATGFGVPLYELYRGAFPEIDGIPYQEPTDGALDLPEGLTATTEDLRAFIHLLELPESVKKPIIEHINSQHEKSVQKQTKKKKTAV